MVRAMIGFSFMNESSEASPQTDEACKQKKFEIRISKLERNDRAELLKVEKFSMFVMNNAIQRSGFLLRCLFGRNGEDFQFQESTLRIDGDDVSDSNLLTGFGHLSVYFYDT